METRIDEERKVYVIEATMDELKKERNDYEKNLGNIICIINYQ